MPGPSLLIPIDAAWTAELTARTALTGDVHWKIEIDDGGGFDDYTAYLDRNQVQISGSSSIFKAAEATSAAFSFRNSPKLFSEGDLANAPVKISVSVGAAGPLRIFTGYVSEQGCTRDKRSLVADKISLTAYDPAKYRGLQRKVKYVAMLNFKICDTGTPAASLAHVLAGQMGLAAGDCDFLDILETKDYVGLDGQTPAWTELQDLALQHGAFLGFRYDGKLRLLVWSAADWNAAAPEYTFDDSNIHNWTGVGSEIFCNDAKTEYSTYQTLAVGSVIYKNTDNWDADYLRNDITVAAGEYWPGGTDNLAVGRLNYGYNGEAYPIGISIIAPTIGGVGSGSDIEATGVLTLVSFNGSTADTHQNLDSSEIILWNNTGNSIKIRKFQIRGTPLRELAKVKVENIDASATNEWDRVQQEIPGKYATSVASAKQICKRWTDFGKTARKRYTATVDFTPHMQCGAIVHFHPNADVELDCFVEGYSHASSGPHSRTVTTLRLVERIDYSAVGAGDVAHESTPPGPADSIGELETEIANRPAFSSVLNGFVSTGGTTTPTVPTIQLCRGTYHGIVLMWDHQLNLSNFDHYEVQVSDDAGAHWYELVFDETDWKGPEGDVTETTSELVVHSGLSTEALTYQVRRVTQAGVASAWSTAAGATSLDVADATASLNAMWLNTLTVGFLQAVFAQITGELIVGASYQIGTTPPEGALKTVIQGGVLANKEYVAGGWVTLVQMGGTDAARWYLQARGLIQVGVDPSTVGPGDLIPTGFKHFKFDADYEDEAGSDPWTMVSDCSIVADSIFKRAQVLELAGSSTGVLSETATNSWTRGNSFSVDLALHCVPMITLTETVFYLEDDGANLVRVYFANTGHAIVAIYKGGVAYSLQSSNAVDLSNYTHLSVGYDAASDKIYIVLNGIGTQSGGALGGAWSASGAKRTAIFGPDDAAVVRVSDLIFKLTAMLDTTIAASVAKAQAHYATGQPWSYAGIDALKDLLLIAKSGGKIRAESPVRGFGEIEAIDYADRSTTPLVNTSTNTAGTWSAAVTVSLPSYAAGAKAVWCPFVLSKVATTPALAVEKASGVTLDDITASNQIRKYWHYAPGSAGNIFYGMIRIPLDSSAQFKWCTNVSSSSVEIDYPVGYEK